VRSSFKAKGKGLERLQKLAEQLKARPEIKVGLLGVGDSRPGELTNVELGVIHEYGAPRAGIPERSWLRATADLKRREWLALLERALKVALRGKLTVDQALEVVGQKAVADIQARIRRGAGIPPPLQPATIAAKGSTRPLVDTGRFVQGISYQVVRGATDRR